MTTENQNNPNEEENEEDGGTEGIENEAQGRASAAGMSAGGLYIPVEQLYISRPLKVEESEQPKQQEKVDYIIQRGLSELAFRQSKLEKDETTAIWKVPGEKNLFVREVLPNPFKVKWQMSSEEKDSRHEIDSRWFYLFLSSLQCLLSNEKKETAVLALNEMVEVDEGRDWFEFSHRRPSQSNRILLVGGQPGKGGYYLVDLKKRSEEELNRPYCVDFLELSPSRPESKWEDIQKLFSRLGRYVNWPELQSIQSEEVH